MKKAEQQLLKSFRWKGIHANGRKVSGQLLAMSELEVRERLNDQHITIIKIKKRSVSFITRVTQRVRSKDITRVTRQLATMLATGLPIIQALKLVIDNHTKAEMKSILIHISKGVESGIPISKAMQTASVHFDNLYIDLVATGEQAGNLAEVFERIATYREKSERLRAKVIKALIYPTMVVFTALSVSYLMLTMVIPEFEAMFRGFGADLPWFTQQVLALSEWVQEYGAISIISLCGLIFVLRLICARSSHAKLTASRISLNSPIIGMVLTKASIAKFSRTLATSFTAGIPILTSLKASAKTANSIYFQRAIDSVYSDTAAGMPIYIAMRNTNAFPEMVLQMIMIGEESGRLDDMLNRIATVYECEIDNTVDSLGKILEPLIILFLGIVVGGLVIAMYLPIFNLMSVMG